MVSPSLTFRTDVQLVQMPAKQARGRVSSSANQISPPSALLNSLKELNGNYAAVLDGEPSCPVFARHVADVGRAAIRLHPEQFLEVDRLTLRLKLFGSFLGGIHQRLRRRWHAPSRCDELPALGARANDRCLVIRKNAGHWREVADVPVHDAMMAAWLVVIE